jgi:hypothetical protein
MALKKQQQISRLNAPIAMHRALIVTRNDDKRLDVQECDARND